jgi:hypothetical protein
MMAKKGIVHMGDNVQEIMEEMDDEEMIDDDDLFGD